MSIKNCHWQYLELGRARVMGPGALIVVRALGVHVGHKLLWMCQAESVQITECYFFHAGLVVAQVNACSALSPSLIV